MMEKKPNVLLIMVDQLRYDSLGFVGKVPVKTPNIDRLARKGLSFTNAFTTIPTCCPARQSFLTGDTAEHIGALWNYDITLPVASLMPETPTWTKLLSDKGYSCAYIGKWHCSPVYDPTNFGFERYYGEIDYEKYIESKGYDDFKAVGWKGACSPVPVEESRTHILAKEALKSIYEFEKRNAPWLVCLEFPEPHLPCHPSEPFFSLYTREDAVPWEGFYDDLKDKPLMQKRQLKNWNVEGYSWDDWAPTVAAYYGIISQLDDAVGKVLDELERTGTADNTVIIFTSDHGDMCGSHGMPDKHYNMYDDVTHVPLIMKLPNVIPENAISDQLISHTLDVPRTLTDILDVEPMDTMVGHSFNHWFQRYELNEQRKVTAKPIRDCVIATYHGAQFGLYCQRMIRTKKYKFIWNPTDINELYDTESDPGELNNCIGKKEYAQIELELSKELYKKLIELNDDIVKESWLAYQLTGERKPITINPTV